MKFTFSHLKKFLKTTKTAEEICYALTNSGLEIENLHDRSKGLSDFIVAEITNSVPCPNSDKLSICTVNDGLQELQIICGAGNARSGIKIVLAPIGAIIPNGGFKIKKTTICGVESFGMLCSSEELNLGEIIPCLEGGIIEMPEHAEIGKSLIEYYGINDAVFEINITPNRADALGVYGIARDLAAQNMGILQAVEETTIKGEFNSKYKLSIDDEEACPLFRLYEIQGVNNIQSPEWLQNLLRNIGISPISAIVDITNYISHSFGQPMHAYDADKIKAGLRVSILDKEVKFSALNDKDYILSAGDLVISEYNELEEVQCLAGIIGGIQSACSMQTTNILLESAAFDFLYITKSGRKHGIETDSRYRFERFVDSNGCAKIHDIAAKMILDICGGKISEAMQCGAPKNNNTQIVLPGDFFEKKIGYKMDISQQVDILVKLGFKCEIGKTEEIIVTIPSFRSDISIKEDLIEELCRINGYNNIPVTPLPINNMQTSSNALTKLTNDNSFGRFRRMQRFLAASGFQEIISWSFMNSKIAQEFTKIVDSKKIANPISAELNYMRPSILPNLLHITASNINRSLFDFSLFELGPVFKPENADNEMQLCAIRTGNDSPKNWHKSSQLLDVYDMKQNLADVLAEIGLDINNCRLENTNIPSYYHPTRTAFLYLGKQMIAIFGEIHPKIIKLFGIKQKVFAFELMLENLPIPKNKLGAKPELKLCNYQKVVRDYAFIVADNVEGGDIINTISMVHKKLIKNVNIFDIYRGDEIGADNKSVALTVTLQDENKTMSDADLSLIHDSIIDSVRNKLGGKIRM